MRYITWALRAVIFLLLLGFAVKNDQPVVLRFFFGFEWQASLVVILLFFLTAGVLIGVLAMLGNMFRQRRELSALRRDLQLKNKLAEIDNSQHNPIYPS